MYIDHYIMSGKKGDPCQIIAPKELGKYLKKLRKERECSQLTAVKLSGATIAQCTVSALERAQLSFIQWKTYKALTTYVWWLEGKKREEDRILDAPGKLPTTITYKDAYKLEMDRQMEMVEELAKLEYSRGRVDGMLTVVVSALFGAFLGFILVQLF